MPGSRLGRVTNCLETVRRTLIGVASSEIGVNGTMHTSLPHSTSQGNRLR